MNLVLFDPELGSFLDKLVSLPNYQLKKLKFRNLNQNNDENNPNKSSSSTSSDASNKDVSNDKNNLTQNRKSQYKNCNKCYICKLELNLNEISHLVCKLVKLGLRKLVVYLVLSNEKYLYSTITLNYVRCLYSRIIMNYEHYFNDLNIINHNIIDITVLPLYNYQKLMDNNINIININLNDKPKLDLSVDNVNNYVYVNTRFMFNEFYNPKLNLSNKSTRNNDNLEKQEKTNRQNDSQGDKLTLDEFDCMRVNNTESQKDEDNTETESNKNNLLWLKLYDYVMFCGTFDYLHFGHKLLLLSAFLLFKKKLHIGVTASKELLCNKSNYTEIQPLETRKSYLKYYLGYLLNAYGPEKDDNSTTIATGIAANTSSDTSTQSTNSNSTSSNANKLDKTDSNNNNNDNLEKEEKTNNQNDFVEKTYRYTSIDFNMDTDSHFGSYTSPNENKNTNNMDLNDDLNNDSHNFSNVDDCDSIKIFDLFDVIGPSCELQDKFGLLLTPELLHNGIEVNKLRKKLNLVPWDLIIVGLVCYQSESKLVKLSSSTIRKSV